jgi:hAT family C-terminal dimerisation region
MDVKSFIRFLPGNYCFQPLSTGIIRMLCLPISNAEVERVFSQVNLTKSSQRSLMKGHLLESILYCKFGLSKFEMNVKDFKPTPAMLMFDSSIYN